MKINQFGQNVNPTLHIRYYADIMLSENGELILKNKEIVNVMIISDQLLTTFAWITGMIIPCHRRKVLIGLLISSNAIKTTEALTLPLISKVYERLIYNQLSEYTESFLSHILCAFKIPHSTQHALFKLLQS